MDMSILETKGLKKYYGEEPTIVKALDGVDLEIEQGSFTAIVGKSGSGKSTMLHMIGGLDTPTEGSIQVAGRELSSMNDDELTVFRRRQIGFVFQSYNLVPILNAYEKVRRESGVGIGLYLTREILARQGGYITVRSGPGEGSSFSLFLSNERPV